MKIKCKTTVAVAREDDRSKPHIQLYKDKVMEVDDVIALTAIDLGFAVKYKTSKTSISENEDTNEDIIDEKMVEHTHQNKMMDTPSANKEVKRGRPPKSIEN